jgi:hypothetical protein
MHQPDPSQPCISKVFRNAFYLRCSHLWADQAADQALSKVAASWLNLRCRGGDGGGGGGAEQGCTHRQSSELFAHASHFCFTCNVRWDAEMKGRRPARGWLGGTSVPPLLPAARIFRQVARLPRTCRWSLLWLLCCLQPGSILGRAAMRRMSHDHVGPAWQPTLAQEESTPQTLSNPT